MYNFKKVFLGWLFTVALLGSAHASQTIDAEGLVSNQPMPYPLFADREVQDILLPLASNAPSSVESRKRKFGVGDNSPPKRRRAESPRGRAKTI